jgi:hypothetical protein
MRRLEQLVNRGEAERAYQTCDFLLMDALWNGAHFRKARLGRISILVFNPQPSYCTKV